MVEQEILESNRLIIRKFNINDLNDMFEYAGDDCVTRYLPWETYKTKEDLLKYLQGILNRYSKEEFAPWAIELKEENKLIGSIDIRVDEKNFCAEIGYVLNRSYWGKGLMTEALGQVVAFGFEKLNLNRIEMRHDTRNEASRQSNTKKRT